MFVVKNTTGHQGEVKIGDTWRVIAEGETIFSSSKPSIVSNGLICYYNSAITEPSEDADYVPPIEGAVFNEEENDNSNSISLHDEEGDD